MKKEQLKPYIIAKRLRDSANRCTRVNADVALLCEAALRAAEWLESDAEDIAALGGSVTHAAICGLITPGVAL